jgi:hypothetical protein
MVISSDCLNQGEQTLLFQSELLVISAIGSMHSPMASTATPVSAAAEQEHDQNDN